MGHTAPIEADTVGGLIRHWRTARGLSQMHLALDVGVSPRHMSFVETGRSRASRALLIRLADRLQIPSREQNVMLERAGYARQFRESSLSDPDLDQVMRVLRFVLERHEPNSALVFDAAWDIVMSNRAHQRALEFFLGNTVDGEITSNLLRLTFHPDGLQPYIVNFRQVAPLLLRRVNREIAEAPSNTRLAAVAAEVRSYPVVEMNDSADVDATLLLPLHLRKGNVDVRLFSVLSTIGSATDVTLKELRVESFFAADPASQAALAALVDGPAHEETSQDL